MSSEDTALIRPRASQDPKADSKRYVSKKHRQEKKKRRDVNPPSDSDPSSDSSDDDSSSESSDDSLDENPGVNLTAASATQAGTTLLTFRPYINSNTLGEFDTKASLRERVHWRERFANMAAQGGWSTKMRIQELKLKLPGAARDWKKYRKARSSYSERYFTMEMKNSESALDFFYRLNSAAGKADIDFRKSSKRLEKHIRRFITKLRDTRLKTSLQVNSEEIREYKLNLGERYGWWEDNDRDPKKRDVAMVHGAVNDCRTKVLLDTGATVNIVSLDLVRKLGLRLKSHKQTKVSGMGGVPTYIGDSTQVKITLGPRVVYLLVWVANIGEGIEVLLGMSFMFAAGVRISVREGLVTLPDEETIVMCGWNSEERLGVDMPTGSWYLAPGESKVVKISYGMTNPQREVVNISGKNVWIDNRTPGARIVDYGFFPRAGRFVRPGSFAYREWQTLILENVQSREGRA
ncbi:Hypothetical protein PHPALM_12502 [Phytophthora palmivora]|uniref:Peptidase A2 domain-containing protein n=1 Tax=Phytophthora palmivora TaxID=4796 RepID=A0A2P4XZL6_9STRA|nr:Hypothetical protein PHPALM_12502 [Phytophthora palmivora]